MSFTLPARWIQLRPHPAGEAYSLSKHRFNTVPAGRRSGKTERAKRKLIMRSIAACFDWPARYFAAAPTYGQVKKIYWDDLKALSPPALLANISEGELWIEYVNGTKLFLIGLDKPARIEGTPWDGGVVDEIGNVKPGAWGENIRPALSDRKGWCDFVGVPEGRNHYYDLDRAAKAAMKDKGAASEWGSFSWPSKDVVDPAEIESAMRDLDPLTFDQEYNASFVNFSGRAYYQFFEESHCHSLKYDPRLPIAFCFDFNVEPGVCAIVQEQVLPGQYHRNTAGITLLDKPITGTGVIGEVYIPRNSNTPAVCKKIIADWGKHAGPVRCYGDATGGARGSAQTEGSDWDLIRKQLNAHFKQGVDYRVKSANPRERARVNAMNSRLKTSIGDIRMLVDGAKAPHVVRDLEGVALLEGGSGEIDKDKKKYALLTHISDALGYYVDYEFPIAEHELMQVQLGGM